jgi:hypothetical protein
MLLNSRGLEPRLERSARNGMVPSFHTARVICVYLPCNFNYSGGRKSCHTRLWVKLGPQPTSELGQFIPQQRTFGDYCGMSEKCQEPASTQLFDHIADLPFDDLINYPISRRLP